MKILLLDDDTRDVPAIAAVWTLLGHTVVQVEKWQNLTEVLKTHSFDCSLIDLMMPAIDLPISGGGFTTGEYLYVTYIYPELNDKPFAVFSAALSDLDVIKRAVRVLSGYSGFRGYFKKGVDTKELLEAISK